MTARELGRLLDFAGPHVRRLLAGSVLCGFLLFCVELSIAFALASLLGLIAGSVATVSPHWTAKMLDSPGRILGAVLVLSLLRAVLTLTQEYLRGVTSESFRRTHASTLVRTTVLSRSPNSAEFAHIYNDQLNHAAEAVMSIQQIALASVTAVFTFGFVLVANPVLTLAAAGFGALLLVPVRILNNRIRTWGHEIVRNAAELSHRMVNAVRNILLIRIYGLEQREIQFAQQRIDEHLRHTAHYNILSGIISAYPPLVGAVIVCSLAAIAIYQIAGTRDLLPFLYLFFRLAQLATQVLGAYGRIVFRSSSVNALMEYLRRRPALAADEGTETGRAQMRGPLAWRLLDVSYAYPGASAPVIRNLNLNIDGGTCLVITGPSGVGKTTLLALLVGELLPTGGEVRFAIGDVSTPTSANRSMLLEGLGYVGPEPLLIPATVRENLLFGIQEAVDDSRLNQAIAAAECEFLFEHPSGLARHITEQGEGLSAGQKQRLSLCRAFLRNPAGLILDEATSNLDADTEARIVERLRSLKGHVTLVVATHRQAMLAIADQKLAL